MICTFSEISHMANFCLLVLQTERQVDNFSEASKLFIVTVITFYLSQFSLDLVKLFTVLV